MEQSGDGETAAWHEPDRHSMQWRPNTTDLLMTAICDVVAQIDG
jgi:hypothetical protein